MPNIYKTCIECQRDYYFKETDQAFYQAQGFAEPKRCFPCRQRRKADRIAQTGLPPEVVVSASDAPSSKRSKKKNVPDDND